MHAGHHALHPTVTARLLWHKMCAAMPDDTSEAVQESDRSRLATEWRPDKPCTHSGSLAASSLAAA